MMAGFVIGFVAGAVAGALLCAHLILSRLVRLVTDAGRVSRAAADAAAAAAAAELRDADDELLDEVARAYRLGTPLSAPVIRSVDEITLRVVDELLSGLGGAR
jgi:hypothetical protein